MRKKIRLLKVEVFEAFTEVEETQEPTPWVGSFWAYQGPTYVEGLVEALLRKEARRNAESRGS